MRTVVINPQSESLMIFARGAKQLVVQLAFDTTSDIITGICAR